MGHVHIEEQYRHQFVRAVTTISAGEAEVATILENTNYNNFGETYCESACYDGIHPVFRDNLIVKPADVHGTGIRGDDGVHAAAVFERQTNFSLDYNGFYRMPGSGDPAPRISLRYLLCYLIPRSEELSVTLIFPCRLWADLSVGRSLPSRIRRI